MSKALGWIFPTDYWLWMYPFLSSVKWVFDKYQLSGLIHGHNWVSVDGAENSLCLWEALYFAKQVLYLWEVCRVLPRNALFDATLPRSMVSRRTQKQVYSGWVRCGFQPSVFPTRPKPPSVQYSPLSTRLTPLPLRYVPRSNARTKWTFLWCRISEAKGRVCSQVRHRLTSP